MVQNTRARMGKLNMVNLKSSGLKWAGLLLIRPNSMSGWKTGYEMR